jgi:hypothetical protein
MKRLSDFKPLALLELPDIGTVPGVGLTLIVGPNSAGKTRLLNDLYSRLCGDPRHPVVARRIELNKPEYQPLIDRLKDEGYIRISFEGGRDQLVVKTPYLGTGEVQQPIAMDQVRGWYDAYPTWEGVDSDRQNEFLLRIGRLLVTKLSLERRLTGLGTVGVINFETAPPGTELHSLRVNDAARSELAAETVATFGKAVWPDHARGDSLSLRVADGELPTADDRHSFVKMSNYRTIEDEGGRAKVIRLNLHRAASRPAPGLPHLMSRKCVFILLRHTVWADSSGGTPHRRRPRRLWPPIAPTSSVACCSRPATLRSFACREPVANFTRTVFPPTSSRQRWRTHPSCRDNS